MKNKLFFAALVFASVGLPSCSAPENDQEGVKDPCLTVESWCPETLIWSEDPTDRCYCPCLNHETCAGSSEPAKCGVLLNEDGKRFLPDGFPFVCRIVGAETEVPQ